MLDRASASSAAVTTAPQLRIERLQHLGVNSSGRHVAKRWSHVLIQPLDVVLTGSCLQLGDFQPSVEQLVEGRVRPRLPALVDLSEEAGDSPFGVAWGVGHLVDVPPAPGQRIDAGVDASAERAAREGLDRPAGPLPATR
jgi:hypothetical protein